MGSPSRANIASACASACRNSKPGDRRRSTASVRMDHVDGLAEPREYGQRLRQRLTELEAGRPPQLDGARAYFIVEKILARGEPLAENRDVDGTTGYDFMNDVGALLHEPEGAEPLAHNWADR